MNDPIEIQESETEISSLAEVLIDEAADRIDEPLVDDLEAIALPQIRVEDESTRQIDGRYFVRLDGFEACRRTETGVRIRVSGSEAEIDVVDPDVFRINISPENFPCPPPTYAVVRDRSTWSGAFELAETEREIVLTTAALRIRVGKTPFKIEAFRPDGSPVLESPGDDELGSYASLNDEFIVSRARAAPSAVLGLGQKTGPLDRTGRSLILWNTDVLNPRSVKEFGAGFKPSDPKGDPRSREWDPYYISIPFYQTLDAKGRFAGFFMDSHYRGDYDFSQPGRTLIRFTGGAYTEYVFAGPDPERILSAYSDLTGRIEPPPIWSLGYHHCRWHPYSAKDVLEKAKTYRERDIPCDSLWLDIDHMEGYRVFTWSKRLFPKPAETLAALQGMGFKAVTIVDPGVKVEPGNEVYESGKAKGVYCRTEQGADYLGQVWPGRTAFPDFANGRAREWWGELNAKHVQFGLSGIWNDMNEPATGDISDARMRFDEGRYPHEAYHNAYALLMAMATHEGLRKARSNERPFILSRAGSAGIQRYAANWLGDNMSRWDHLAMSIPMSLGLGISGQPFVGADIGGFGENCEPELLVRWFQAAALSPFCRNHNDAGGIDQYPWSFGPEVEEYCKAALDLRYRLMPYLYTAFVEASESGSPIMRPLLLEDPSDQRLRNIQDEYLFGPSLLVAPIVEKGSVRRRVRFPKGEWFDWWSEAAVTEAERTVEAPMGRIPLFARAGAVIPMWPEAPPSATGYHPRSIDLHVLVPSADGTRRSRLVEDDGATYGYRSGDRLTTLFTLARSGREIHLRAETSGRIYPGYQRQTFRIVLRGAAEPRSVEVDAAASGFEWSGAVG